MPLTPADVRHVAALARLSLGDAEVAALTDEVGRILEHIERLRACDTEGVPPTAHALSLTAGREAGLRPDDPRPPLPVEAALANAPAAHRGFFLVPRVVEGDDVG
jgi:aspartyl-tRNA(Asn)/glutamyl-tRNA(Gln) amidotransferase subunit C